MGSSSLGRPRSRRTGFSAASFLILIILLVSAVSFGYFSAVIMNLSNGPSMPHHYSLRASAPIPAQKVDGQSLETISDLRKRLPPSIWTLAGRNSNPDIARRVASNLTQAEKEKSMDLCGKFLFSSLSRAVQVGDMGGNTYVATGDIDAMWTRDSAVQMGIYLGRMGSAPFLRLAVEGAIRRQAFNTIQDPYANAYNRRWQDPVKLPPKDRVIGRGGWVSTRNYELDSGAYFLTQLFDYYVTEDLYRPEAMLDDPMVFDAVMLMVDTWIVEQHHDDESPYRYFELPNGGKGLNTSYTGMTWSGFRPSDDACRYSYLVPANIHAAAALERVLELNKRIWQSDNLERKTSRLLDSIADGIRRYGVVRTKTGERIYAYEVDGQGNVLSDFDDANVPSLLSIPLLGWTGYDREVYSATRARLLSSSTNTYYYSGRSLSGIGSPHTKKDYVWPMAFAIEALTTEGSEELIANSLVLQMRQSLASACKDAMHESVDSRKGCAGGFSRVWFEWANAMFVVLVETALGGRCDSSGRVSALKAVALTEAQGIKLHFYSNRYKNDYRAPSFYQGVEAMVTHYE